MRVDLIRNILSRSYRSKNYQERSDLRRRFSIVYRKNLWNDDESRSGPGSRRDSGSVSATLDALEHIAREYKIGTLNDIPCGDFNWIDQFLARHESISYHGFDVVPELIEDNRNRASKYRFDHLDITYQVPPRADLILCKDLLNHLRFSDVERALHNFYRSGSRLILASNNFGYKNKELGIFLPHGSRHLDITSKPFSVPAPIWQTHYLGLWYVEDLI